MAAEDPRAARLRPRAVEYAAPGWYRARVPPTAGSPAACVLALHGYGQPAEEMEDYALRVAPEHAVVLVPEGPLSFYRKPGGAGGAAAGGVGHAWIADPRRDEADARNARFLDAVWADAAAVHPLDPARTAVLGYSQGVGVGVHWLIERPGRAAALVALAGGVRVPLRPRLGGLRDLSVLWVTGQHDRAYPRDYATELLRVLAEAGLAVDHRELDVGHGVLEPAEAHVRAFLAARLGAPDARV